jgi:hypothetical protein
MDVKLEKEKALEGYFTAFSQIPPPISNSGLSMARYSARCLAVIERLYDDGYLNGYKDALNTDFEYKK